MDSLLQDFLFGLRSLGRRPAFSAMAVAMLAVGIGANTAIFSVVHAVVLKPLPYESPDELFYMGRLREGDMSSLSAPEVLAIQENVRSFENVATWNEEALNLVGEGEPERISGARVSTSLLPLLGVEPVLGRAFTAEEGVAGDDTVALVSEASWRRRYGASPDVIGRTLRLNGRQHTVVGVVPDLFSFMEPGVELFVPFAFTENEMQNPGAHFLLALGRLAPGALPEAAAAELEALVERTTAEFPDAHRGSHGATVSPLPSRLVRDHKQALLVLTAAVGFVLLIACANVANLLLARAAERRRELSIRTAMGAGQARLLRQLLTESLLLAGLGGAFGLLFALWSIDLIVRLSPKDIPRIDAVAVDWTVFAFVAAISLAAGVLFGLFPALKASRDELERSVHETARGEVGTSGGEASRNALVAAEIALSLVLLVGAGLTARSFWELGKVSPGFEPRSLITARLLLPDSRYEESEAQVAFARGLLEELEAAPGVESVGLVSPLPFSGSLWRISVELPSRPETAEEQLGANWRTVSPGYFRTMGIPLLAGRDFEPSDMKEVEEGGRSVAVVNETFARNMFPGEDALGKDIVVGYNDIVCEIVGIVGAVRHRDLATEAGDEMYTAFAATPLSEISLAVRASGDPSSLARSIRDAVWRVDPEQPVYAVETMPSLVRESVAPQRFIMMLMAAFAVVALFLSSLGIYAVVSYSVVRRTREIGIRMALGARSREVLTLVLGRGMRLIAWGAAFGVGAALLLSRFLASQLYGISATDFGTYVVVALTLASVALGAMAAPAYRASKADPLTALRHD